MSNTIRFGRKIPMPSTIAIKHELRLMAAVDAVEKAGLWSGANLIVERFGSGNRSGVAVDHGDPRGPSSMVA